MRLPICLMALLERMPASFMNVIVSIRAMVSPLTSLRDYSLRYLTAFQNLGSSTSKARPKVSRVYTSLLVADCLPSLYSNHWLT